jgi:DNA-binding transcriptional MerR regulator
MQRAWKVGELARATGLTVRTLHHYHDIGLLVPSLNSDGGHRLYTAADVARLQRVVSLRQIGFSLEEIRGCLDDPAFDAPRVIGLHLARLRGQIARQQDLCTRLEGLAALLAARGEEVSPDEFLRTIEATTMIENYYTPEQLEYLKKRREEVGEDAIRSAEKEWPELLAKAKAAMEAGTDPADPAVQAMAKRMRELVEGFTGGNPGVRESLNKLWKEQGANLAAQHNLPFDPRLGEYINKAHAAARQ